jgi:hypothetical protein
MASPDLDCRHDHPDVGVGLVHSGHDVGDPIAAASSLLVLADMLLFGWLVFRPEPIGLTDKRSSVPAE